MRLAIGAIAVTAVFLGSAQPALAAQESQPLQDVASSTAEIAVVSPGQYQQVLEDNDLTQNQSGTIQRNVNATVASANDVSYADAADTAPNDAWLTTRDFKDGKTKVPLRHGTSKWGYKKIKAKHGLTSLKLIGATISNGDKNNDRGADNPNWVAVTYYTNKPEISEEIIVGALMKRGSKQPSPVTGVQGVLTAYCNGKVICPSWVNNLGS